MVDIEEIGHRANRKFQTDPTLFEEDPDRTTIILRGEGCGTEGLSQLLPTAEYPIPYKGYTLDGVAQYVLVRMAETVSSELATKMMSVHEPSMGFMRIKSHMGDDYDPEQFSENSADIYCYMVEAYRLLSQINEEFSRMLLLTGDSMILTYEHSWLNSQWGAEPLGIGDEEQVVWAGENIVGRALEDVRESMRLDGQSAVYVGTIRGETPPEGF